MALESATYVSELVETNPVGASDQKSKGDDHLRLIKAVLKNSFANITGAMTASHTELNSLAGRATFVDTFLQAVNEAAARAALGLGSASTRAVGVIDTDIADNATLKGTARVFEKQQTPANGSLVITSGACTWDLDDEQAGEVTLSENITSFTISNQVASTNYQLLIKQDVTGGRTITWPSAVKWPYGGTAPMLSSGSLAVDIVTFRSDGTNLFGIHIPNFG